MKIKSRKLYQEDILAFSIVMYGIQYFLHFSTITYPGIITNILLYASTALNVLVILWNASRIRIRNLIFSIAAIIIMFVIYAVIPYSIYFWYFLFLIAMKKCNAKYLLHKIANTMMSILLCLSILSLLRVIPDIVKQGNRHGLGLNNYVMGFYFFNYSAISLYTSAKKKLFPQIILFSLISCLIYYFTRTRLTLILTMLFYILILLSEKNIIRFDYKILKNLFLFYFPIITLLMYWLCVHYDSSNGLMSFVNTILSGRLGFQHRNLVNFGISLLPRNIKYDAIRTATGIYTTYIDSGYVDLLVRFGIIVTIFIVLIYSFALYKASKRNDKKLICWLICIGIFNIVNNSYMNIFYDSSLLLIWTEMNTYKDTLYFNTNKRTYL